MHVGAKEIIVAEPARRSLRCKRCGSRNHFIRRHARKCFCGSNRFRVEGVIHRHRVKVNPLNGEPWPFSTDSVPIELALKA